MQAAGSTECTHPESEIYENLSICARVCGRCGKVMSENELRVESAYPSATGHSQAAVIPRFRPITRTLVTHTGQSHFTMSKACLDSVQRDLTNLSHRLRTSTSVVETAKRLYAMLNERRMHTGVERRITLGVCLYIACRLEKTNHVLSQFVHGVGTTVNVFTALFVRISHALELGLHCASTDSYLETLVEHLELGPRAPLVLARAEEILERMHEEWIDYGRYPFGVVAAAVLIACQMSGLAQCIEKLSQMVMLTSHTLLTRLKEFQRSKAVRSGSNDGSSVPPCFRSQKDAQYLVKRLHSYNERLRDIRNTIVEMVAGTTQVKTPLIEATWKSYWNTRAVASAICQQIVESGSFREEGKPQEPIPPEHFERVMLKYGVPAYIQMRTPALDAEGISLIRREIAVYDEGKSAEAAGMSMKQEAFSQEETMGKTQAKREKEDDFYINAIESEGHDAAEDIWEMVSLAQRRDADSSFPAEDTASTARSQASRIDRFPEIEYDEAVIKRREAFISDALQQTIHREEVHAPPRSIAHSESLQENASVLQRALPSDISFRSALSSASRVSKRSRSQIEVSASSPGHAMLARVQKGLRSKINANALVELLDGKAEGIDVPSWNESVVNMQNLRGAEDALSSASC